MKKNILNLLLNYPDQNISNQFKPKKLLYIKSLGTDKTGVTAMRSDGQTTADKNPISPTVSVRIHRGIKRQHPRLHQNTHHKNSTPNISTRCKRNYYITSMTIKLFGFPIFRFWATWWRLFQKRSCALNLISTFLLPLFCNVAIWMFSLKPRYTHCLIWYIQNVCKIAR